MHNFMCLKIIHVLVRIMNSFFSNSSNTSPSILPRIIPLAIFILGLVGLYYLYQYLFGPKNGNSFPLITDNRSAKVDPDKALKFTSDKLPLLYEGGEFTFSTWIYISSWTPLQGQNKAILLLGGNNFDTMRIYLGARTPSLQVKFHTTGSENELQAAMRNSVFIPGSSSDLLNTSSACDLPEIPLQRWVNITISVNGKTVDVYMDGKLARSCVLPSYFKVDTQYNATLLSYGGFGGQIANTSFFDAALNPDAVYKMYMAGPEPITSLSQLFSSIFSFNISVN
jgi:hypothetical protein